ncbi:anthocyanidin 3-O-glucosyltransferase 7-like [Cryptomeria japonica]|uniref:anthocyanidin 3-O-glucosyltransferase 7-like n=1 Tax=Cryptomeria japonica TaxID=3369 RepID=UPI0027DA239A|nr:anthocyanidin 3-O-glucosyltransferase 7-like [Cryptomeria japonica]XP_059071601.1 anthocyanidin 3-O-glucosyltransferase 7-like [Cryptomeria japonica]XP_059071602.1 anthocyanidin 3-O-glucosyltransferase 7-like [Cryptomeria japonica]XP_059072079.1 anthocyanidin 3-O-glucosyltransferase 7-like [Cryptomeria japonica]
MAPHALLIPLPAQGHVNPMMQLAWKLVSNEFFVTFLNSDSNHNRILTANTPNSFFDNIRMISVPVEIAPIDTLKGIENGIEALAKDMGPSVIDRVIQEINAREEENKVTCIIADVWMCFGLQPVATLHKLPLAAFHTSPVSLFAMRYFSAHLVSLGILHSDGIAKEEKKMKYLPCMPALHSGDLPWLWAGEYMFRKGIRMGEEIKAIKWVLFNSFSEIEAPVVETLSKEVGVYPIGPLIPLEFLHSRTSTKVLPSFWKNDTDCLQWLDKQCAHSVIYISFGSLAGLSEKQLEELALGVEATRRPFLWVVRSDLMKGSKAIFPAGFLERVRDRGCLVSWVPQLEVLTHPSIACFVTHCGWNSVQESITMGVPMLCWPHFSDQFLNRTYVVEVWKLGLSFNANSQGIIEQGEFVKSVEILLESEQGLKIREEAKKLKIIARDAVKDGGSSSNNFNLFVTAMKRQPNE